MQCLSTFNLNFIIFCKKYAIQTTSAGGDWPQSLMSIFSKTDNLSKIAIYKLYLEVEVLGLDISKSVNLTIREDRIFR